MRTDGLRPLVEALDLEMSRYVAAGKLPGGPDAAALLASWADLVAFLALGPAPELRACPSCGESGMRDATRCGHCWRTLEPVVRAAQA